MIVDYYDRYSFHGVQNRLMAENTYSKCTPSNSRKRNKALEYYYSIANLPYSIIIATIPPPLSSLYQIGTWLILPE